MWVVDQRRPPSHTPLSCVQGDVNVHAPCHLDLLCAFSFLNLRTRDYMDKLDWLDTPVSWDTSIVALISDKPSGVRVVSESSIILYSCATGWSVWFFCINVDLLSTCRVTHSTTPWLLYLLPALAIMHNVPRPLAVITFVVWLQYTSLRCRGVGRWVSVDANAVTRWLLRSSQLLCEQLLGYTSIFLSSHFSSFLADMLDD